MKCEKSKLSAIVFYTVITVLCLVFPNIAFALQSGDFTYTVSDSTVTITAYSCPLTPTEVVIPTTIDGMPVVGIGYGAFYNCYSLTSVTIPNSVIMIYPNAFYNCYSLTSVTIPNSVIIIGQSAFYNCSSLTSVTIGNNVTSIVTYAFQYCSGLTSVTIPASVTSIGHGAFKYCKRLTRAYFLGNAPSMVMGYREFHFGYYVRDGVFDKCALNFTICYTAESTGFTFPLWYGYPAKVCENNQCAAEAIYGENSKQTELLRKYRDNVLNKTPEGQELINAYYKLSPAVTEILERRPLLKDNARMIIDNMLPGIRKKVRERSK